MRNKTYTDKDEKRILDLSADGKTPKKIAAIVRVAYSVVISVRNKHGIKSRAKISDETKSKIIRMRRAGVRLKTISGEIGLGIEQVKSVLYRAGVRLTPKTKTEKSPFGDYRVALGGYGNYDRDFFDLKPEHRTALEEIREARRRVAEQMER